MEGNRGQGVTAEVEEKAVENAATGNQPQQVDTKYVEQELNYCRFVYQQLTEHGRVTIPKELHKEIVKCMRIQFRYITTSNLSKKRDLRLANSSTRMSKNAEKRIKCCATELFKTCVYFGTTGEIRMLKFMRTFGKFDGTALHPQLDPFGGKVVFIDTSRFVIPSERIMELVSSFFKNYGQHISSLNLTLPENEDTAQNNRWLLECLSLLPNLKYLKVNKNVEEEEGNEREFDLQFGEHEEPSRAGIVEEIKEIFDMAVEEYCEFYEYVNADKLHRFGKMKEGFFSMTTNPPIPQVEQSLETLKLCSLPSLNFNTLIQKYGKSVSWLHIEPPNNCVEYVDWGALEFPNLKSFYVKLRSQAEAQKLGSLHPSWGSLTKLHLDYDWKAEFMGWGDLLKIVQGKWGGNLIDLKLRLPKATTEEEKVRVGDDVAKETLILPKLKTLKIWISGPQDDAPLDFLKAVKEQVGNEFELSTD